MAAVIELSLVGDEVMLQLLNLLLSFPDLAVQVMVAFDVTWQSPVIDLGDDVGNILEDIWVGM